MNLTLLRTLIPKLLATRLMLMFAIMISFILSMYAWQTAQRESQSRLEVLESALDALTYQVSVSSKRFIITSDFAELENIALAFVQYPGVEKLLILQDNGVPLVYAKNDGASAEIDYSFETQVIDKSALGTFKQGTKLVSTREMLLGDEHLWIQLFRDNTEFEQIRNQALLASFTWAGLGILASLLILFWALRAPMQLLQKAAYFARTLPYQHNQTLDFTRGGQEVIDLGNALSSAAKELSERDARLADAQRIAHLGNWETVFANQEHDELSHWSDQCFKILGLDAGQHEASYELFLKFVHPEDVEKVHQYRNLMTSNKEGSSYECRIIRQDGEQRYLNISAELLHDKEDNVIGILGTMQDITERKEVEKLKDEFISTVSHELRTPLTSIRGSLGLVRGLTSSGDLPDKITSLLDIAHNNTERLLHLINDILDISKIESGQLALSYTTIRLQEFLEQAVVNNQHYAEDVEIKLLDDVGDIQVEADSDRLMQIMNNLISNACKFSPRGSKVEIGAKLKKQSVEISIRDYGSGIPEEYQPKLFEKFTQADASNTRNVSGTGLGLSITKALVEKHGGSIGFESRVNEGTRFYFELPVIEH